jgi:hypothetical protein
MLPAVSRGIERPAIAWAHLRLSLLALWLSLLSLRALLLRTRLLFWPRLRLWTRLLLRPGLGGLRSWLYLRPHLLLGL